MLKTYTVIYFPLPLCSILTAIKQPEELFKVAKVLSPTNLVRLQ